MRTLIDGLRGVTAKDIFDGVAIFAAMSFVAAVAAFAVPIH